jgi:hypothetical protein
MLFPAQLHSCLDVAPALHPVFEVSHPSPQAAHARQRAAEQQQQQGHGAQPDQRLQPPVPAQARPQPVPASTHVGFLINGRCRICLHLQFLVC